MILSWDDPIRIAERAAMLDVMSGGRLELGVGKGVGFREEELFDVPKDRGALQRRYAESIDVIQLAWTGEEFQFEGEFFRTPKLIMVPRPQRQPAPLYLAAASEDGAAFAGSRGLPFVSSSWPHADVDALKTRRASYLRAAQEAGHDVEQLETPFLIPVFCGESDAEAEEIGEEYLTKFQYIAEAHYEALRGRAAAHIDLVAQGDDPLEIVSDLTRDGLELGLIGSAETVAEKLRELERDLGLTYLVHQILGGVPHDKALASVRRFAEYVMPRFATSLRAVPV